LKTGCLKSRSRLSSGNPRDRRRQLGRSQHRIADGASPTSRAASRRGGAEPARRGRRGTPTSPDAAPAPITDRIPRVARVLTLAHHRQGLIRSGAVLDPADLARLVGVSRARVTQVMSLRLLAPDIQEALLDGRLDGPKTERALRTTAGLPQWSEQRGASSREHRARPAG
jgi:hypothetical protein